jgi:hypothetical protein
MRILIIIVLLLLLLTACGQKNTVHNIGLVPTTNMIYTDSSYMVLSTAFNEQKLKADTLIKKYDSLKYLCDSLRTKYFLAQYKVENVRNYIKIVERNKSQKVFFFGWVKRAVK